MAERGMWIIEPGSLNSAVLVHGKPSRMSVVRSTRTNHSAKRTRRQRLKELELKGEIKLGSGKVPESFWAMPMPSDPEGSVRQALTEDRR